jgi:STAGA complex 65 subunit gamma
MFIVNFRLLIKNALVTQTVETINQTESIKCIMDTYLDPSCQLGSSQLMPNIDFPASNSAKMKEESVFSKPVWFCQPKPLSTLSPKNYTELTKPTVLEALKKSLCGLLKMSGFTEIDDSALKMYVDGIDEFYKSIMENVRDVMIAEDREKENMLDILILEKAYTNLSNKSLTTLHNYFKDEIIKSNRDEINEFKDIFQEYDKMLHENNLAQNLTNLTNDPKENGDFFLHASSMVSGSGGGNINVMNFLDGDK